MSIFYPDKLLHRVTDLSAGLVAEWGVKALVLDVDNTLTTHNNPVPDPAVLEWLEEMKRLGMKLVILSNNKAERVEPFARRLGIGYTANAMKPLTKGLRETARRLKLEPGEMVMVGDQIFTDILAGRFFGCKTILVEPMDPHEEWQIRLKRRLEAPILKKYNKRGKR